MKKYNPHIHHRRSIRLKGYDYSQAGLYFITICCQDRICRFGHIENGEMLLNEYGQIAFKEWVKLPNRFHNMEMDVFQIMPNHFHGIIQLNNPIVGAEFTPAQNNPNPKYHRDPKNNLDIKNDGHKSAITKIAPNVSDIVGVYKSLVANGCLEIYKLKNETMGKLWQRNYHEHIIRNEQSYQRISDYIINNPAKWEADKFYITSKS